MEVSGSLSCQEESSACYLLRVRVIRARNLRQADILTPTDCYITLWLPTASSTLFRTKTVQNCKDPVWNETFHFMVQSKVKNILELGVCDEDVFQDEHIFTVRFDISGLPLNKKVPICFDSNPQDNEKLEVEFELQNSSRTSEAITTNGVLLSRQMCHLELELEKKKTQKTRQRLSLVMKGSHEGHREFSLGSNFDMRPTERCTFHCFKYMDPDMRTTERCTFHYIRYMDPTLDIKLPKTNLDYVFGPCSYNREEGSLKLKIISIPTSKKTLLAENNKLALHARREDCCSGLDVRLGYTLCDQEQEFICKRKKIVAGALKRVLRLEKDLKEHEVPVIAIMTTGGSMRSLTAMYGSLRGLQKCNLIDCATYITGLSGTTWAMTNLYRDAYWSKKDLNEQINEVKKHVIKSKLDCFGLQRLKYYKRQLRLRKQEGQKTSYIDFWGLIIEYLLNDGKNNDKLSDQQKAIIEGQNPLPIYTAINVKEKYSTVDYKEWIEFTPYEVGILKYGVFVRAEDFGSEFFMGRLMKKLPETRICYMEGMWSSIYSLNLLYFWNSSHSSEDFWHKWTRDHITDIDEEPQQSTRPHEHKTTLYTPPGALSCALRDVLTDRLSVAQYHNFLRGLQVDNSYLQNDNFSRWKDTVLDSSSPSQLTQTEDYLSIIDTGFFINTSCAPLLREERKVDVILHLNYSSGSQSLPLKQSCKNFAEHGIPFPKAVLKEDDQHLKECYLFEDADIPEAPILLFFPQVNDSFRYYKAPGVKRSQSEMKEGDVDLTSNRTPYSTYSMTFSEEEYDQLIGLSEYNILNNQHLILQALQMALERKRRLQ